MDKIKPLLQHSQIHYRIRELAEEIKKDFSKEVHCVVVLTGAIVFFSELMKQLHHLGVEVYFYPVKLSSYMGEKSTGKITLELDAPDVKERDILIVEDIVDTGLTVHFLKKHLLKKGAKSIKICTFLDKKARRKISITPEYIGFEISDKFVVGYGLDYNGKYRDLEYVGTIK